MYIFIHKKMPRQRHLPEWRLAPMALFSQKNRLLVRGLAPILRALFRQKVDEFMRRPKGIKTKKSVAKRFKITASGKVLRSSAGRRHLLQTKHPKRRRSLRGTTGV